MPPNQIIDLLPGELFVHRNIANLIVEGDINSLSVIEYAVKVLEVDHIIICGHYGCGGVKAAMDDAKIGLIDQWLQHIQTQSFFNDEQLNDLPEDEKYNRFCELNVIEQVKKVCQTTIVQKAWEEGTKLTAHGWIYALEDGIIRDLEVSISSNEGLNEI